MAITISDVSQDILSQITNKTTVSSITPAIDGANRQLILDFISQQARVKTTGTTSLTATQQVLAFDINSLSFGGGKCYLPSSELIGREILVIANSANIEVYANVANTSKLFNVFGSFLTKITMNVNEMYRFTYIGFATEGYWKAELI